MDHSYKPLPALAASLLAALVTTDPAQAAERRAYLDEVIVRATRVEDDRLKVPYAVGAIDLDDIQRGQQLGLDESLNQVPGLFFQNRYNFAQDLRVSIRGFGARANFGIRGIKLFVDGIPSTTTDGQGGVDDIDLGSARRIEVIRGPASSLYGSAAGGVISLYTEDGPETPFVQAGLSAGDFDYERYRLKTGGQLGGLNYLVSSSYLNMDGYRGHSRVQHGQVSGKFRYTFADDSELTAIVNAFDSPRADDPGGLTAAQVAVNRKQPFCGLNAFNDACRFESGEAIDQQKVGFVYRRSFGEAHELTLRNYYVWREFASNQPSQALGAIAFDRFFLGGGAQYTWTGALFGRANRLTIGFDIEAQEDDRQRYVNLAGTRGAQTLDQLEQADGQGFYFQNEFMILEGLELSFGGRYDLLDLSIADRFTANGDQSGDLEFDEFSPMVGLVWSPITELNVYFNYGEAFETPTFTEFGQLTAGGFNPDVTAQSADSYEIGAKGIIAGRLGYDVAAYRTDVSDEIINTVTIGSRAFFNNADTERRGIEAALSVNVFEGLDATLVYTYSDFEFERFMADPSIEGNRLPGLPRHQFYGAVSYEHPSGLYVSWDFLHVGDYFADNANSARNQSYEVSTLRFGRPFVFGALRIEPQIGINNLFNEAYNGNVRVNAAASRYFEPAPEKNFFGGVTVRYEFGS